jgi:hypothetical protein
MAKALYGHLSGPDPRLLAEVARLRALVVRLEAENAALRSELGGLPTDLVVPEQEAVPA